MGKVDSANTLLAAKGVTKAFGPPQAEVAALRGVDLELHESEFLSIHGPSGSGKSTLLHVLAGLTAPTSGKVVFAGQSIANLSQKELLQLRRNDFGFVFQFFNLIADLSVTENIALPLMLRGDRRAEATRKSVELGAAVGLQDRADFLVKTLSGGEMQRVAIARALAPEPSVVFADEPTGNLDQATGEQILQVLSDQCADRSVALLAVTHDEKVISAADRVIELIDGQIVGERLLESGPRDPAIVN